MDDAVRDRFQTLMAHLEKMSGEAIELHVKLSRELSQARIRDHADNRMYQPARGRSVSRRASKKR